MEPTHLTENSALFSELYRAFNAREIDAVLAHLHPEVDWPASTEGGRVTGHQAVREYWTRQWSQMDPCVEPLEVSTLPDGQVRLRVRQLVRDLAGQEIMDTEVTHVYQMKDGLAIRMDIE